MPTGFDVILGPDGDLPEVTHHSRGVDAVIQRVRFRLLTFKGEWLLDITVGQPYDQWRVRGANLKNIASRIKQTIIDTPGVLRMTRFLALFDEDSRTYTFVGDFEVEDFNEPVTIEIDPRQVRTNETAAVVFSGPARQVIA